MIAPSLHADLRARGVRLSIEPGGQLRVQAPAGALNESLRLAINEHRDDLLQFIFELEERAAILEYEQGNTQEDAERLARECVRFGTATADGQLWLREYALNHPAIRAMQEAHRRVFGCDMEIVSIERRAA